MQDFLQEKLSIATNPGAKGLKKTDRGHSAKDPGGDDSVTFILLFRVLPWTYARLDSFIVFILSHCPSPFTPPPSFFSMKVGVQISEWLRATRQMLSIATEDSIVAPLTNSNQFLPI